MLRKRDVRLAAGVAALAVFLAPGALAQSPSEAYYKAYYLEHEKGELDAARELYQKVAASRSVGAELKSAAKGRAAVISEELRASDFANLMPPETIFYAEINHPGERIGELLSQLGLMADGGTPSADTFGISPLLVRGLLGVGGIAVGVTEINPRTGDPNGVIVLDPGDLDVVRGLIETVVPGGCKPSEPIAGFPTWKIEGENFVTLTSRLVIVSDDARQIAGVLARLKGEDRSSLASSDALESAMAMRGDDLLFFCVNVEPVMPMIQGLIMQQAESDPQVAVMMDVMDIASTRSLAGRLGIGKDGLGLDVALQLADDHQNLLFNLMRKPHLNEGTFDLVPEGAAFFLATSFNESAPIASATKDGQGRPIVTMMDFGREIFGNVVDLAVFGVPSAGGSSGMPIPDVAAVVRVNDIERSQAIWNMVLGMASQSAGGSMQPESTRVAGLDASRFTIQGIPVYVAANGNSIIVSPSTHAVEMAVKAGKGNSIATDSVFADTVACIDESSTMTFMANPGRLAGMVEAFVPASERAQIMMVAGLLANTVICVDSDHSTTRVALHARVHNIPNVGPLVRQAIAQATGIPVQSRAVAAHTKPSYIEQEAGLARVARGAQDTPIRAAGKAAKAAPAKVGDDPAALRKSFARLVANGDMKGARKVGKQLAKAAREDAMFLNETAWMLLKDDPYAGKFGELALGMSKRSNEFSDKGNWMYVDTLALAYFEQGKVAKAIALEKKAIKLAGDHERVGEAKKTLERFQAAAGAKSDKQKVAKKQSGKKKVANKKVAKEKPVKAVTFDGVMARVNELIAADDLEGAGKAALEIAHTKDHEAMNRLAWSFLTVEGLQGNFDEVAYKISNRSNALTDFENWMYLDTLALASFERGMVARAVELEQKAVKLAGDDDRVGEAKAALERFMTAQASEAGAKKKAASYQVDDGDFEALRAKFDVLATREKNRAAALDVAKRAAKVAKGDAKALNNFAWQLLTEGRYEGAYNNVALKLSMRSNEVSGFANWLFVDTLALAIFEQGDIERAIEMETLAIRLAGDDPQRGDAEKALARFKKALAKQGVGTK